MNKGYTFIELLVSMGILAILFALITINLSPLPSNTLQVANLDVLLSDIRSQQTLSMSTNSPYGIHFENDSYTLFKGGSFTQGLSANTIINLDSGIVFSNVTFPGRIVVFSPGSGDITDYSAGQDRFTIGSSVTGRLSTVRLNKHGATY